MHFSIAARRTREYAKYHRVSNSGYIGNNDMQEENTVLLSTKDEIAHIQLHRPDKKNAISDRLISHLEQCIMDIPEEAKVVVVSGSGSEFCAGLDLSEHVSRDAFGVFQCSRVWHRVFNLLHNCGLPVISAVHGAVIGGGLELAASTHICVADETAFFKLPEGRHGIFVGGGASVRVGRIIGARRMTDMMLTGRVFNAQEGYALGLNQYVVPKGEALDKAFELAGVVAQNSKLSNWAMATGLTRVDSMSLDDGLYTESLLAGMTQTGGEIEERIGSFLNRKKA